MKSVKDEVRYKLADYIWWELTNQTSDLVWRQVRKVDNRSVIQIINNIREQNEIS